LNKRKSAKTQSQSIGDYAHRVHLYGSLSTGTDSVGCDIDLAIECPPRCSPVNLLKELATVLQSHKVKKSKKFKVKRILHAKVPILKLTDPLYDMETDISVYKNHDATVKYLREITWWNGDDRIRQLIVAIKHWSKRRELNCTMTGKINSFGYTILVLKYLQIVDPAIVPVMDHQMVKMGDKQREKILNSAKWKAQSEEDPFRKYWTTSSDYHSMRLLPHKKAVGDSNEHTLNELVYGFFEFWGQFDYTRFQVSLHTRGMAKKHRWGYKQQKNQLTFVIQDPVDTEHNVAKNVREETAELLIHEFKRAQLLLLYGASWDDVCVGTDEHGNVWYAEVLWEQVMQYRNGCGLKGETRQKVDEYIVTKFQFEEQRIADSQLFEYDYHGMGGGAAKKTKRSKAKRKQFRRRKNTL